MPDVYAEVKRSGKEIFCDSPKLSRHFHESTISLIEQTHRTDYTPRRAERSAQFYKVTVGVETNPGRLRPSTFRESTHVYIFAAYAAHEPAHIPFLNLARSGTLASFPWS